MRTVFDIVLGILESVVNGCLQALVSAGGLILMFAVVGAGAAYAFRRRAAARERLAETVEAISIER